jgi:hypothetical protein
VSASALIVTKPGTGKLPVTGVELGSNGLGSALVDGPDGLTAPIGEADASGMDAPTDGEADADEHDARTSPVSRALVRRALRMSPMEFRCLSAGATTRAKRLAIGTPSTSSAAKTPTT